VHAAYVHCIQTGFPDDLTWRSSLFHSPLDKASGRDIRGEAKYTMCAFRLETVWSQMSIARLIDVSQDLSAGMISAGAVLTQSFGGHGRHEC
jgi:hypothetical protein